MAYESLGHMPRAPLVYSLAMIQYAPVARIAEYSGTIIEELRSQYPDSGDYTVNEIRVHLADSPEKMQMAKNEVRQWRMTNAEGNFGFVFGEDRIVFHTTAYEHFQGFAEQLKPIIEVVFKCARVSHTKEIGFRQIDNILPIDNLDFADLINPGYLCPTQNEALTPAQSRVEFVYQSDLGQFFARCYQLKNHPKLPQDLFQLGNQLPQAGLMKEISKVFVLADTDHIYRTAKFEVFDMENVLNKLDELHKQNSLGFRAMVTRDALAAWGRA